jgi:hypothetical protein
MKRNHALVSAARIAALLLAVFPKLVGGQAGNSPSHPFSVLEKTFSNYSKDFRALEGQLHGDEWQEVDFLDGVAATAEDRLHAANAIFEMYNNISCAPDRVKVKPILKELLDYYSWQMGNEADRSAGSLQFAKMPAVVQMGLKMKDDLRTAKNRLDEVATSLK